MLNKEKNQCGPDIINFGSMVANQQRFDAWRVFYKECLQKRVTSELFDNLDQYLLSTDSDLGADIIAINKPPGLLTYSGYTSTEYGVAETVALRTRNDAVVALHRLDRNTSGVLLLGRTKEVRGKVGDVFRKRNLTKEYITIVKGEIAENTQVVNAGIVYSGEKKQFAAAKQGAKPAQSIIQQLAIVRDGKQSYTVLKVQILTGRTHQIRVHTSQVLGTPIVGDQLYGLDEERFITDRQLLHAHRLILRGDFAGIAYKAPVPKDFHQFIDQRRIVAASDAFYEAFGYTGNSA